MPSVAFGQTLTGKINKDIYFAAAVNSAVGATLLDGSRLICKAGGKAWFVAPTSTQISSQWANGQYNSTAVGNKCCISEWGVLGSCLSANVCCYVATDWFIPTLAQLQNPGYICRTNWVFSAASYWSSTEVNATNACGLGFILGGAYGFYKSYSNCVRAFRCVTY